MAATSSAAPTSGPKISMLGAKAGFIIPRNKLFGAFVPTIRGVKKSRDNDAADEERSNQVQRKTKWGPDLTEDASVKRGRALAYQARVDQITQKLKSGTLEVGDDQDLLDAQHAEVESSSPQIDNEMSELWNIEKREAIGEILKLNPSYKAPADYKPVLKEARVPIPVKDYPGYNFLGFIFGPGNGIHKWLETERGAKLEVFGTKESSREKVEISPSDGNDFQTDYEELYILVSAETLEKVDAAVSLIELLVTSVSGNLAAVSVSASLPVDSATQGQDSATHPTVINQGMVHPVPTPSQGQLMSSGPSQFPLQFSSGLYSSRDFSAPIWSNPVNMQPSPFNPSATPSLFGPGQAPAVGYNSVLQNQPPSIQLLTSAYMPQTNPLDHNLPPGNISMPAPQPSSAQPNISAPFSFSGSQPQPTGPIGSQLMSSLSQPGSGIPPRPLPDRPLDPGWSRNPMNIQPYLVPNSSGQFTPLTIPQRPQPANPQLVIPSMVPPANTSASHMAMPVSFPSGSPAIRSSMVPVNRPMTAPIFNSVPNSRVGSSHSTPVGLPGVPMAPTPSPSVNPIFGSTPNFTPIRPKMTQHPSSGDFTFQPNRTPNLASQMGPWPGGHPLTNGGPNILAPDSQSPRLMVQSLGPQAPPFRFPVPNTSPQPVVQNFVRPHVGNRMGQVMASVLPRPPAYQGPQMEMGNFTSAHQRHLAVPIPPRPGNNLQLQQNYPTSVTPRENSVASSQRFNNNFLVASGNSASSRGQQVYDPFSPTSVAVPPQQQRSNPSK